MPGGSILVIVATRSLDYTTRIRHPARGSQEEIGLIEGEMFWTDEERLAVLALLLENVGMDPAVALGDLKLWRVP